MNQRPPTPNRLLNLCFVFFSNHESIDQTVDLALDGLVRNRYFLWHSGPRCTYTNVLQQSANQTAEPRIDWGLSHFWALKRLLTFHEWKKSCMRYGFWKTGYD